MSHDVNRHYVRCGQDLHLTTYAVPVNVELPTHGRLSGH